ncbi:MAG: sulfite exporter TauE/SafE family protein [Gammaproteobacteria bacterium]|nr:sulfite exporter TauE/SafE family protein [Gammaproteobacteria bacterium]
MTTLTASLSLPTLALLPTSELLLALLIVIIAYLVRGITGFGSGLIAIPLLALLLPVTLVVPLIGLLDYTASLFHGLHHRQAVVWREIFTLLPFTITGVVTALYLFHLLDPLLLRKFLGGFVLLYAIYSLSSANPGAGSRFWVVPAGLLGGMVGTLFGTGGPFYVIYLRLRGLGKLPFRATVATIFLLDGSSRIIGYTLTGVYNQETMLLLLLAFPLMVIALYLGGRIHSNASPLFFRRTIGIVLLGSGSSLLLS